MTQEQRDKALTDALVEVKAMAVDAAILKAKLLENIALSTRALLARETLIKAWEIPFRSGSFEIEFKRRFCRFCVYVEGPPAPVYAGFKLSHLSCGGVELVNEPVSMETFQKVVRYTQAFDINMGALVDSGSTLYELNCRADRVKFTVTDWPGFRIALAAYDDGL